MNQPTDLAVAEVEVVQQCNVAPRAGVAATAGGATEIAVAPDELMSLSEAAHHLGIKVTELRRDVSGGIVRNWGGRVRPSEVLADRKTNATFRTQPGDGLISIAEAARALGLNRSTLSRQVRRGLIRSHPNGVVLADVIADRATNINHRFSRK